MLILSIVFISCKKSENKGKKDTTQPVITLNGSSNMELSKGYAATDPGATAKDDTDGDISASVTSDWSSKVNINQSGDYTVTYSVSDKAGNSASATRNVKVKYNAAGMLGTYNATHTNGSSTSAVYTAVASVGGNSNEFKVYPFSGANINVTMTMGGPNNNQLTFSHTEFGNTYAGTGTIDNGGNTMNFTYTVYTGIGNFPHTSQLNRQ